MTNQREVTDEHSRDSAGLTYIYSVVSRRAGGVSIGINLNPNRACNWHCIYCQVPGLTRGSAPAIDLALLEQELRGFIDTFLRGAAHRIVDIAFSGNGESTSAKEFPDAVALAGRVMREMKLDASVKLRLITNGSLVAQRRVQAGLRRLGELDGEVWFKVDAGSADGYRRINGVELSPQTVARNLRRCSALCTTWVQTCLFALDGQGPTETEVDAYLDLLMQAGIENLKGIHLYGLARTPMQQEANRLSRLPDKKIAAVADRLQALRVPGLTVRVSP